MEVKPDPALIAAAPAPRKVLPMPNGQYISPAAWHQLYANGIVIKDIRHKLFTQWMEPPPFGASHTHTFDSQLDFQLSTDGGATFIAARAPATMTVQISDEREFQGRTTYETTVTQLDVAGGDLPPGVMIRESPTKASMGGTSSLAGGGGGGAGGGAAISSFFDIFTEVSTDGGGSWGPATNGPAQMELERIAPVSHLFADNLLPPLTGEYVSPQQWHAYYASGIVITNVIHRTFTSSSITPPLPGATVSHTFGSQVEFDVSLRRRPELHAYDRPGHGELFRSPAGWAVTASTSIYDTEMTATDIAGGGAAGGASRSAKARPRRRWAARPQLSCGGTGGYQIDSFFDIFTEVSTDGGLSWWPTVAGPATVTLLPRGPQTALSITCPSNITVRATSPAGAVVNYTVTGQRRLSALHHQLHAAQRQHLPDRHHGGQLQRHRCLRRAGQLFLHGDGAAATAEAVLPAESPAADQRHVRAADAGSPFLSRAASSSATSPTGVFIAGRRAATFARRQRHQVVHLPGGTGRFVQLWH